MILCERGIRTFETSTRNTLDISAIPVLKQETHLPVIVDPSHAAGRADLVPALAAAAVAVGADGLIVEVHPDPASALSDGAQSLTLEAFAEMMRMLAPLAALCGRRLEMPVAVPRGLARGEWRAVGAAGVRMIELRVATQPRVAYQGEPGAYGEMAIAREWRGVATALGASDVRRDDRDCSDVVAPTIAVIPMWNSTIGDIKDTSRAARASCVASGDGVGARRPGRSLPARASRRVARDVCGTSGSHPTALAQCRRLFATPGGRCSLVWRTTRPARRASLPR